ncbi:MAG: ABC transporter permease [Flavobacteriales bacterium]|nr:ABC transporter permease [Flavobacteriales bacterium]
MCCFEFFKTLKSFWQKYRKNKLAVAGLFFIGLCFLLAISGYLFAPDKSTNCNEMHLEISKKPIGYSAFFWQANNSEKATIRQVFFNGKKAENTLFLYDNQGDTSFANMVQYNETTKTKLTKQRFWLGTDGFGRDVLSRLILGTRVSLSVGLISVLISLIIGISLGLLAGYYRGWVDAAVMWLINVIWSLPTLLLVIAITFALGKGFWQIFVAVGLTMWVELARVVRGQVFALRETEYVQAAKMLGFGNMRIMFRHILPNCVGPIVVLCAANFASAILLEAGLSFLGLGVQPPTPSWGQMLNENYSDIAFGAAHLALAPGMAIMLLVMAFNFVGNGLRDALDVKL